MNRTSIRSYIVCKSFVAIASIALALVSFVACQYWDIRNFASSGSYRRVEGGYYYYNQQRVAAVEQMSVTVASKRFSDLGEGPYWDANSQSLLYVDAFVGDICRLIPDSGETEAIHFEGKTVTFVIPYASNSRKMLISVENEVRALHWDTRSTELMVVPDSEIAGNRFNDAKVDYYGRLWAGTLNGQHKESGFLYRIDTNFQFHRFAEKMTVSNGITWTLDNQRMFFIDSDVRRIYEFDFDVVNGDATNQRVLVDFNANPDFHDYGYPDGMTIDEENKLWVACFGAGRVVRIDPDTTQILRTIELPVSKVTSVAFGGAHYNELFITTAKRDLSPEQARKEPLAGAVFKVTGLGVRGRPPYAFGL